MTSPKQLLLDAEDRGWRGLCARMNRIAEEDWLRPGVNGDWNAKDLLAHVAAWHAATTDRLEALRMTGELPPFASEDVDAFNLARYEECRDLSLHDVRVISGAARHRFREEIDLLSDDPAEPLPLIVRANAEEHYDEHLPGLDAFLGAA